MHIHEQSLGQRIKELRIKQNFSQIQFAKILNIRNSTLCMYENDNTVPSDDIKKKMAEFFNVSLDYLITGYESNLENDEIKVLNEREQKLLDILQMLSEDAQDIVLEYAEFTHLKQVQKDSKNKNSKLLA